MATNPAAAQLYPLSTQEGDAIPLDVVSPIALVGKSYAAGVTTPFTPVASWTICSFYSMIGCIVQFGNTIPAAPVDGIVYPKSFLVLPDTLMVVAVDASVVWTICPILGAGTLFINPIQKWAALALARQVTKK